MPTIQQKPNPLTVDDLKSVRYPLPESWKKAAGMLKHKQINALQYQRKVRAEWDRRFKKLEHQLSSR